MDGSIMIVLLVPLPCFEVKVIIVLPSCPNMSDQVEFCVSKIERGVHPGLRKTPFTDQVAGINGINGRPG